jgi:hypothetical protein
VSIPLSFETSDDAKRIIKDILNKLSDDAADRFVDAYEQRINELCRNIPASIEQGFPPSPHEDASLALSRPTYRAKIETSKTRARRSSSGVWYVFFLLIDGDGDRIPETLQVISVRHGSALPMWRTSSPDSDEE